MNQHKGNLHSCNPHSSGQLRRPRQRRPRGGAYHWREYHVQELLPPAAEAKQVLLLGCGDAGERFYLSKLGFETVAFDIAPTSGADFLADAHHIPLRNEAFDVVLSMQVLEHLHSPWLAVREITRVLRPGGWFVGSVAFLKPYHGSYFHMTHKGTVHLLTSHGLDVDKLMGAQSLTYTLYGTLLPLGTRSISKFVYGTMDRLLSSLRARLWSLRTGLDPDQPTDRFDEVSRLSFRAFERLRFAPAVVFRAQKVSGGE
jgi:SAM-dependent methyltransferase